MINRMFFCGGAMFLAAITFLSAGNAPAQDEVQRKRAELLQGRSGGDLVPAATLEKLSLNKEQKEKFDKINQEFQTKAKEFQTKIQDAYKNREREKAKAAMDDQQKLRTDSLTAVKGLLNDTQKKTLESAPAPAAPIRPGIRPGAPQTGGATPGQLVSPQLQEKLKLTDDQKKKLEDLQKDVDGKLQNLLTDEQRKILDESKKAGQPRRRAAP